MTRRTDTEIEQELDNLQRAIDADPQSHKRLARKVMRLRMSPGQVTSAYKDGGHELEAFDLAMSAANWMLGLSEQRPSAA